MQTFKQKNIALAVGSALLVMAGAAQAVAVAPTVRAAASNPALVTSLNGGTADSDIRDMLSTGYTGIVNVNMPLTAVAPTGVTGTWTAVAVNVESTVTVTAGMTAGIQVGMTVSGGAGATLIPAGTTVTAISASPLGTTIGITSTVGLIPVNAAAAALTFSYPAALTIFTGNAGAIETAGAAAALTVKAGAVTINGVNATLAPNTIGGVAQLDIALPPAATITGASALAAAYRVTPAGALELTLDGVTWTAVTIDIAANGFWTEGNGDGTFVVLNGDTGVAALAAVAIGNSLAPTPTVCTTSSATIADGELVSGFKIDTGTPIATPAATNLVVKTAGNTGLVTGTVYAAASMATPVVCAAGTSTTTTAITASTCTITFPDLGTLATAADLVLPTGTINALDTAAYNSTHFNTGVNGASAPFSVDGKAVAIAFGSITQGTLAAAGTIYTVTPASMSGITVGMRVTGLAIPAGATVATVTATTFTYLNTAVTILSGAVAPVDIVVDSPILYTKVFNPVDGTQLSLSGAAASGFAGVAAVFDPTLANPITDCAAPVIVAGGINFFPPSVATPGNPSLTNMNVVFSEPMTLIGMNDLREVLENIYVGTDTLAALSLNSGASPRLAGIDNTGGQGSLGIDGVSTLDVATLSAGVWTGKPMSVSRGITYQEVNDTDYTTNLAAGTTLDIVSGTGAYGEELGGGVMSLTSGAAWSVPTGLVEAVPTTTAQTAVAPVPSVAWGTDTSALASSTSAETGHPELIDTITVTFKAGKSVKLAPAGTTFGTAPALAAAKTNADLTANLVVDVHGAIGAPVALNVTSAPTAFTVVVSSTAGVVPGATIIDPFGGDNTVAAVNNATNTLTLVSFWSGFTGSTTAYQGTVFQVKPLSATLDGTNQITVKLPTALIYSRLAALDAHLAAVYIGYVADGDNAVNNTLVSTDVASTLTSPIRVAAGVLQPGGPWTGADEVNLAGAEPVVLPLVFTAVATGGQSTLLTQSIQSNVVGSTGGSVVTAYLALWIDKPTTTISVSGITSGKITNPGDKVAKDLAIEFVGGAGGSGPLAIRIQEELDAVAKATRAIPGVSIAEKAVAAKLIPVYVKLIRSNDVVNSSKGNAAAGGSNYGSSSNGQNYLEARAILATTYSGAKGADTPNQINGVRGADPVFEVLLNPVTGKITGRLTGNITIKTVSTVGVCGLQLLNGGTPDGSSILAAPSATGLPLPGSANLNLLIGIDPSTWTDYSGHVHTGTDFGAIAALKPFVLLVHQDSTGKSTLLTSADPKAANYMPFAPDLFNTTTGAGGVAVRAKAPLSVDDVKTLDLPASSNWALYGLGNPALATKPAVTLTEQASFPRRFVGLDTQAGSTPVSFRAVPVSFWTGDDSNGDIAMSIAGNKVGVATELGALVVGGSCDTLSTISDANRVKGAVGLAWANENGGSDGGTGNLGKIYVAQATGVFAPTTAPAAPRLAKGWSLVTVPAGGTFNTDVVDAVIKVGAQVGITPSATPLTEEGTGAGVGTGQFTWFAVDGAMPTLTAGEAVFVHAKAVGNL